MTPALLPAVAQLAMLRERKISVPELVEEHIRRIERLNPLLNAFVDLDPERVRAQARAVVGGRLAGLPVSLKSCIEVEGHRCEIGSTLRRGLIAEKDAKAVARLRAEGAVILGTTNCPEFLMAYETGNDLYGRTANPWNLDYSAGGSSGGEAAAIAAGLSACGLGSDSGGSVRQPAHAVGICALKPTPGRISDVGCQPPNVGPFSSLGAVGPMARTVPDVELLFEVLCCGPKPYRVVGPEEARTAVVGWFEDDGILPLTRETRASVANAVRELEQQGFRTKHFRPFGLEAARKLWRLFFIQCGAMIYEPTVAGHRGQLSPIFKSFLGTAQEEGPLTATALLQAWVEMDLLRARFRIEMASAGVDLLLLPVCAIPAFKHGEQAWQVDGQEVGYWDVMRYTQWFNLLAMPAAVVPVGQSPEGLPIGVQVAGRPYEDELVLAVAGVINWAFGYRVPPVS